MTVASPAYTCIINHHRRHRRHHLRLETAEMFYAFLEHVVRDINTRDVRG